MNIIIFTNVFGGLYYFRKELVEKIASEYPLICVIPFDKRFSWFEEIGCTGIPIRLDRRRKNIFLDFRLVVNYIKLLRRYKPALLLTYTIKPNLYGSLAAIITGTPYICNITGVGTPIHNKNLISKFLVLLYRFVLSHSNFCFFQNESNLKLLGQKIERSRRTLLPGSGVNLEIFKYEEFPSKRPLIFLFIGRVMRDKGFEEFINAAKIIKEKYSSNLKFFVVGSLEEENYSKLIESMNNDGIITYFGSQKGVNEFSQNSHAVVLPSYHEGMSNVLLEAAATGRPVIASNIPGCRETFDEGISGFGCEPRSVDSLVDAIERFIALPYEQKVAMGLAGRKKMEQEFDRQIVVGAYMREIEIILKENVKKDKKK